MSELSWGATAGQRRSALLTAPLADRAKIMEKMLASSLSSFLLRRVQVGNLELAQVQLLLVYELSSERYAQAAGELPLCGPLLSA